MSSGIHCGMRRNSRGGGMLGSADLRQGSGVTPDSGKTVLRSGLAGKLAEAAGQGACAEKLRPAEIVFVYRCTRSGVCYRGRDVFLNRSTLAEVTFVFYSPTFKPSPKVKPPQSLLTNSGGETQVSKAKPGPLPQRLEIAALSAVTLAGNAKHRISSKDGDK
jgi:hypothetical protein